MTPRLAYPFSSPPEPATTLELAPGIHWLRMPLPFALDHINLWLLADGDGWTLVDCGVGSRETSALWEQLSGTVLHGRPIRRIVVTHYHPDHIGQAGWLSQRYGAPVLMTRGEWELAREMHERSDAEVGGAMADLFRAHGLDGERTRQTRERGNGYRRLVPQLPAQVELIADGDTVTMGEDGWRVIVGRGHAPEHACLYCAERGLLIAGDQILPTISSNVSVRAGGDSGDPMGEFLGSLDRLAELPADTLVLPSHGLIFRGVRQRAAALREHHQEQFDRLLEACSRPRTAADVLEVMFARRLDAHQLMFAMGESIAHLHHLARLKKLHCERDRQGIHRYQARPAG